MGGRSKRTSACNGGSGVKVWLVCMYRNIVTNFRTLNKMNASENIYY